MPQSELVRQAVTWIDDELQKAPCKGLEAVVDDAAMRFNLSPRDVDFLLRFFQENPGATTT